MIAACRRERRCLITLDLDFGNPLRFRPSDYAGIAVLRVPPRAGSGDIIELLKTLVAELSRSSIDGKLWIVQRHRVREYQPADEDAEGDGPRPGA